MSPPSSLPQGRQRKPLFRTALLWPEQRTPSHHASRQPTRASHQAARPARLSRGPTSRLEGTVAGPRRDGTPCPVPKSQLCVPRRPPAAANPSPFPKGGPQERAPHPCAPHMTNLRDDTTPQHVLPRHRALSGSHRSFPDDWTETHVSTATTGDRANPASAPRDPARRCRPQPSERGALPSPLHPVSRRAPNPLSCPVSRGAALRRQEGRAPGSLARPHTATTSGPHPAVSE